jgi:hypothetical protein
MPADGEHVLMSLRPVLDWDDIPGASSYSIQISKYYTFSSILMTGNPGPSTFTPKKNLPANTTLYWRYHHNTSGAWSTIHSFTTPNPPSVPVLTMPRPRGVVTDYTPLLQWNPVGIPTGSFDHYQIQVDTDPLFASPDVDDNTVTTQLNVPPPDLTPDTIYYWRVRAFNTLGEYSDWQKKPRYFRTAITAPVLSVPTDTSTLNLLRPACEWVDVTNASSYIIQVSLSPTFASSVLKKTVTPSTYAMTFDLKPNTIYYWRVQAKALPGHFGPSAYSSPTFSFNTGP